MALRAHGGRDERATPARILAIGNPAIAVAARDASRDGSARDDLSAMAALSHAPKLAGAAREARLVAEYASSADVRIGRDATAAFLKHADLRQYRVLHLATHAFVDEQ